MSTELEIEVARLRKALERIGKTRIGLDSEDTDAEWREYWANTCFEYRQIARKALAGVDE